MRLIFNAPPDHRFIPDASEPDKFVRGGEEFSAASELAERLLATEPEIAPAPATLSNMKRPELDELAVAAGIDPADYKTIADVIAALESDQPEAAGGEGQHTETETKEAT